MSGPAVVVIDPLSFYDELVRDRYANWISPRELRNRDAFVLVLEGRSRCPRAASSRGMPSARWPARWPSTSTGPGVRLQVRPFQRPDR